jgi:hypothetical protein
MSTFVSLRGMHDPLSSAILYTLSMRCNGIPSCTEPSEVSDLISERLGIPSTKYGPSICCGVPSTSINDGVNVQVRFVEALFWVADSSGRGGRGIVVLQIEEKKEKNPLFGCKIEK